MRKVFVIISIVIIGIAVIAALWNYVENEQNQKHQYRFWQEQQRSGNVMGHQRVLFSYSDDYGKTFSDPQDMSMTTANAYEAKMIIMHDDVILVWRDEAPDNLPTLSFAKSTDFGRTFEKKRLFNGASPDIKYYDETLYLTYWEQYWDHTDDTIGYVVWYSKSDNRGQTFSEPKVIFQTNWALTPFDQPPIPTIDVDADKTTITWRMLKDDKYWIWKATDYGKDDSFEITKDVDSKQIR